MLEEETITEEEKAQHYLAMLDSVAFINEVKPECIDAAEWDSAVVHNQEHLALMVAKDYWTDEDMTAVTAAIAV
jgi:hypothetical protein